MPRTILMDEIHLTFLALVGLPTATYSSIRRPLDRRRLSDALRAVVRHALGRHPSLRGVRVRLTR